MIDLLGNWMKQLLVEYALVLWNVISGFEIGTADELLTSFFVQELETALIHREQLIM